MTASHATGGAALDDLQLGPIDYIVLEWKGKEPTGEAAPLLIDLADRGLIRILDIALMAKDADGTCGALDLGAVGSEFAAFDGASSGLIAQEDLDEAAAVLEPGSSAAILIWENRWAAPVAAAMRRSGGELVASGRISLEQLEAALDAAEARQGTGV